MAAGKTKLKMGRYVSIYLGGLTLIMVLVYGILLNKYLILGLDEASGRDMRLAAESFSRNLKNDPDTPLPRAPRMKAFIGTQELPPWVINTFPPHTYRHGKLLVGHDEWGAERFNHGISFLYPYHLSDGRQLLLLKTYTGEELRGEIDIRLLKIFAWLIGLGYILIVVLSVRYMARRLSTPVARLGDWAENLQSSQIDQPHPDFGFDEINQLATQLQTAVKQLNLTLEREHRFLRNASHELRTPIAVAMSNLELLERIRPEPEKMEQVVCGRIRRAVDNMNNLTKALLWLSRDNEHAPSCEPVALDALIPELVAENRYLLKGKSVSVSMDTEPGTLATSRVACRIVLSNLIRNAFQYTDQGNISICVRSHAVVIKNSIEGQTESQPKENDYGFGLGLAIVEQVTQKMNWKYHIRALGMGREVRITFKDHP